MNITKFLGVSMQQQPGVLDGFDRFFRGYQPKRIIELGTGLGGLCVFLAIQSRMSDTILYSYDVNYPDIALFPVIISLGCQFQIKDILSAPEDIGTLIEQDGETLVLCDNGDKVREFNYFAPYLKPNDVIMAHDYYENRMQFQEQFLDVGGHGCCEITDGDIAESCFRNNLTPYMQHIWSKYLWVCRRRL